MTPRRRTHGVCVCVPHATEVSVIWVGQAVLENGWTKIESVGVPSPSLNRITTIPLYVYCRCHCQSSISY